MTPERWRDIERVFEVAAALPVERRDAVIADACAGDDDLRREVERLLANTAAASRLFDQPAGALVLTDKTETGEAATIHPPPSPKQLIGERLGVYHVTARLGAGGMGEVYRARDTRLGREVAIKILPRAFTSDPERLARFEREARVLASLNHTNIGHIYGVEEGLSEDGVGMRALVLELIEGDTLGDRIARDGRPGLPIADALAIARQIADALDAAHEKGIVHRDLKPANIKITPDGVVKVLDFGLAKAASADGSSPDLTHSPTITVGGTREGIILGTAAYMSPEQARGQVVDKRADIWAFGCVLYEMLTGRTAFARDTVTDTLAAIVSAEPDWSAVPTSAPPEVHRLVARCLEKDPRRRLRDIGDARFEPITPAAAIASPLVVHPPGARRAALMVGGAIVLVAAGAAIGYMRRPPAEPSALIPGAFTQLTWDKGYTTQPSISADGRLIAYASDRSGEHNRDIWIQQASGASAIRLTTDPADESQPNLSPDGTFVAFRAEREPAGIYVMPALGGEPRLIAADGRGPRFSPDGRYVAYWSGPPPELAPRSVGVVRRSYIVPVDGGEPVELKTELATAGDPVWAPDGSALLLFGRRRTSAANNDTDWWLVPRDGSTVMRTGVYERLTASGIDVRPIDDQPFPEAWNARGVFFAARAMGSDTRAIWNIAVTSSGRAIGGATLVAGGSALESTPAVSNDGRLVFASISEAATVFGLPLDANRAQPTGTLRRLRQDDLPVFRSSLSQDGSRLAFFTTLRSNSEVWIRDMVTGRERQLAVTPRSPLNPVLSPDGGSIAYTVVLNPAGGNAGKGTGYVIAATGGTPRKACDDCQLFAWTPDSEAVLFVSGDPESVRLVDPRSGRQTTITPPAPFSDRPMVSPDAKWISWNTPDNIFIAPFHPERPIAEAERQTIALSVGPDRVERTAGWSPDSRLLYVLLQRDGFRCLYAYQIDPSTGRASADAREVYHFHDASLTWGSTGYGSAVVNGWFLANLREHRGNIWMTTLTSNNASNVIR